jgi:AcrR family transcriptional regulator
MVGARKQVRGDQLVAKVLRATLAEIGLVGVDGLSIEAVAERAHVNKTTIYRRWPAPEDLAQAALSFAAGAGRPAPDTGSLRGDLRAFVHEFQSAATLPEMRTIMRLRWSGTSKGPLAACTRQIQEKKRAQWKQLLRRAVSRGELPSGTDLDLAHDVMVGALIYLVVLGPKRSSGARLDRAVELLLGGLLHAPRLHAPSQRRPHKRSHLAASRVLAA